MSRIGNLLKQNLNNFILNNEPFKSPEEILSDPNFKYMNKDEFQNIYNQYVNDFNNKDIEKIKDEENDFRKKLDELVVFSSNIHRILTQNEFDKMTKRWKGKNEKPIKEWYKIYYEELHKQPGWSMEIRNNNSNISYTVYKSPNKRKHLIKRLYGKTGDPEKDKTIIDNELKNAKSSKHVHNSFPLKENRKFFLHSVHNPDTYFMDIMFTGRFGYLICINANTRYLYAEVLNGRFKFGEGLRYGSRVVRSSENFINTFESLLNKGFKPKLLVADDEGCFHSQTTLAFYRKHNIQFQGVPRLKKGVYPKFMSKRYEKTEPLHSSLGIVDRVIRTLRDMAYNAEIDVIQPQEMKRLVELYNNSPHATLSYYAGEQVSPLMAQRDPVLEKFIMRRICQENFNVKAQDGYEIPIGEIVKVYNDFDKFDKRRSMIQPGNYYVSDYRRGLYEITNYDTNETQELPRARIQPIEYK